MDDLELLYQLDHGRAIAQAICDFSRDEPGGVLALDGEVNIDSVLDTLMSIDPEARVASVAGGGLIFYQGVKVYYGALAHHPSVKPSRCLCVGQPVVYHSETPYEAQGRPRGLLRRLMGL